jgi:hypothetical protein
VSAFQHHASEHLQRRPGLETTSLANRPHGSFDPFASRAGSPVRRRPAPIGIEIGSQRAQLLEGSGWKRNSISPTLSLIFRPCPLICLRNRAVRRAAA